MVCLTSLFLSMLASLSSGSFPWGFCLMDWLLFNSSQSGVSCLLASELITSSWSQLFSSGGGRKMQSPSAVRLELVCLYQPDHGDLLDTNSFSEYQYQTILLSDHGLSRRKIRLPFKHVWTQSKTTIPYKPKQLKSQIPGSYKWLHWLII